MCSTNSLELSSNLSNDLCRKLLLYILELSNVPANIELVSVPRAWQISNNVPTESPLSPRSSKLMK